MIPVNGFGGASPTKSMTGFSGKSAFRDAAIVGVPAAGTINMAKAKAKANSKVALDSMMQGYKQTLYHAWITRTCVSPCAP